jgi:U3 small nucleolar RNA-associated protein 18
MNLTTAVDTLVFSQDSQLLAMSSRMKKDAMRLVHLPSCSVFSNWPTSRCEQQRPLMHASAKPLWSTRRSPLHYVHSLGFSPNTGFLVIGNARGRALLYRLHHFEQV